MARELEIQKLKVTKDGFCFGVPAFVLLSLFLVAGIGIALFGVALYSDKKEIAYFLWVLAVLVLYGASHYLRASFRSDFIESWKVDREGISINNYQLKPNCVIKWSEIKSLKLYDILYTHLSNFI